MFKFETLQAVVCNGGRVSLVARKVRAGHLAFPVLVVLETTMNEAFPVELPAERQHWREAKVLFRRIAVAIKKIGAAGDRWSLMAFMGRGQFMSASEFAAGLDQIAAGEAIPVDGHLVPASDSRFRP